MKKIHLEDFQNDSGEAFDSEFSEASAGLGSELDAAFLRGRKYRDNGYSLVEARGAVKLKSAAYRKEFVRGWKFSTRPASPNPPPPETEIKPPPIKFVPVTEKAGGAKLKIRRHFRREIKPRQKGSAWIVTVPKDLWFPGNVHWPQFKEKIEAIKFAKQLTAARSSGSAGFFALPPAVQSQLLAMIHKHGSEGLIEADRWLDQRKPQATVGFIQLANDCIHAKEKAGRLRDNTTAKMWISVNSFARFCTKAIHAITTADIVAWLDYKGGALDSRKSRLGIISGVLQFAVDNQTLPFNPADAIQRPKIQPKLAVILPVADIEKLVRAAEQHDPAFLGYLAPVVWGGLRDAEAKRLMAKHVGAEVINMRGDETKTGKRSFQITPVLRAWLAVKDVSPGSGNRNFRSRFAKIQTLAGVKVPHNALRKSCASYWYRLKGSREAAAICGHSEAMLDAHYKNADISLADAEAFEAMRPND